MPSVEALHPTKQRLVDATVMLLDEQGDQEVTIEQVLSASGVSSGSLYHHFQDFPDLLDHAQISRYAAFVERSLALIVTALDDASSAEEYQVNLRAVNEATHRPEYAGVRAVRAQILAQATVRPNLRERIGREQDRLTSAVAQTVLHAQERGYVRVELDPRVIAVFLQAYTFGSIIDDISSTQVDNSAWQYFIQHMIETSILAQ